MPETVLIVDPDPVSRHTLVELLRNASYHTIAADSFAPAAQLVESTRPDLLITSVRLGVYNGLQLVVRGRARDPRMAAVVIDRLGDLPRERQTARAGATAYVGQPFDAGEVLALAAGALAARERRRASRTTVAMNVVVRIGHRHARLLDVSDDGLRLESGAHLPDGFRVELPAIPHGLAVERVWSRLANPGNVWWSGVRLAPTDSERCACWRRIVSTFRTQRVLLP